MAMQLILLERVDNLGNLGDVVTVKSGYARNYLLPQNKALRATKDNIVYFESQKGEIEKQNEQRKKEAQIEAKKLEDFTACVIRHASESGQLYGSVTARDIAEAISEQSKQGIKRDMVEINQTYKMIGLFPITVAFHPEVKVDITINIARSEEEAKKQIKTGRALVIDYDQMPLESAEETPVERIEAKADETAEKAKVKMLEEGALEAEKEKSEEDALKSVEKEEKSKAKSEARAAKKVEMEEAKEDEATAEETVEVTEVSDSAEEVKKVENEE